MRFGAWKNDLILLIMKEVVVCKSHAFKLLTMETRGESKTERRGKEIYAVVCVEMGVANLLDERYCVKYCP